jgi:hypothetical protein
MIHKIFHTPRSGILVSYIHKHTHALTLYQSVLEANAYAHKHFHTHVKYAQITHAIPVRVYVRTHTDNEA